MPDDQHEQHDGPTHASDDGRHDEQDRVRRLLADLAATDSARPAVVPDDVASRLDAALRDVARETRDPGVSRPLAPVVPLRRRWAPALVAAAAVVVVGGIGVAAVTQSSGDTAASDAGAASDTSGEASGSLDQPAEESGEESRAEAQQDSTVPGTTSQSAPDEGNADLGTLQGDSGRMLPAPYLTLGGFADGVATLVAQGQVATGADAVVDADELRRVQGSGCVVPDRSDGAATLVSLEGDPAVLVVAPPADGRQQVEVRSCAAGEALAQSEVTAVG